MGAPESDDRVFLGLPSSDEDVIDLRRRELTVQEEAELVRHGVIEPVELVQLQRIRNGRGHRRLNAGPQGRVRLLCCLEVGGVQQLRIGQRHVHREGHL